MKCFSSVYISGSIRNELSKILAGICECADLFDETRVTVVQDVEEIAQKLFLLKAAESGNYLESKVVIAR